jgi:hypothetical protein
VELQSSSLDELHQADRRKGLPDRTELEQRRGRNGQPRSQVGIAILAGKEHACASGDRQRHPRYSVAGHQVAGVLVDVRYRLLQARRDVAYERHVWLYSSTRFNERNEGIGSRSAEPSLVDLLR